MKLKILIFLFLVITSIFKIEACSCTDEQVSLRKKVKRAFTEDELVISGTVIDIEEIHSYSPKIFSGDPIIYTFEIIKTYKGKTMSKRVKIVSSRGSESCGYRFQKNQTYLVFASLSKYFSKQTKMPSSFITSLCRRNQLLEAVTQKELRMIEKLANK